jgi:hypothetical protein
MTDLPANLKDSISLSEALPKDEVEDLTPGLEFAITAILISHREKGGREGVPKTEWDTVNIIALALPDGARDLKLKSSAAAVVRKCKDLRATSCYNTGACKHPVRVRVISKEGQNGPYLDLEDA